MKTSLTIVAAALALTLGMATTQAPAQSLDAAAKRAVASAASKMGGKVQPRKQSTAAIGAIAGTAAATAKKLGGKSVQPRKQSTGAIGATAKRVAAVAGKRSGGGTGKQ